MTKPRKTAMTDTDTLTDDQITSLSAEAAAAGDLEQVEICRIAQGLGVSDGSYETLSWDVRNALGRMAVFTAREVIVSIIRERDAR